jgi:hypothetical protein
LPTSVHANIALADDKSTKKYRKKYVRSKVSALSHAWIVDISGLSEYEESKEARSKER